jgi:hypothetical protein
MKATIAPKESLIHGFTVNPMALDTHRQACREELHHGGMKA